MLIIDMKHFLKNPKQGKYKLVSHGYLAHEGEKSQGNVVMYHHYDKWDNKQMSLRNMGDNTASSIWQQLDHFDNNWMNLEVR